MQLKQKILFQVIIPLLAGFLIYAFFYPSPPFGGYLPWDNPLLDVSFLPRPLYVIFIFNLPGALWTFSFISALDMVLRDSLKSVIIVMSVIITFEYCQQIDIINGTGDVGDVLASMCSVIIYILFFRRLTNEKMG